MNEERSAESKAPPSDWDDIRIAELSVSVTAPKKKIQKTPFIKMTKKNEEIWRM